MGNTVANVHGNDIAVFGCFPQQDGGSFGNIQVTGAVKAVTPDPMFFIPLERNRVDIRMLWHCLVKRGIEDGDMGDIG